MQELVLRGADTQWLEQDGYGSEIFTSCVDISLVPLPVTANYPQPVPLGLGLGKRSRVNRQSFGFSVKEGRGWDRSVRCVSLRNWWGKDHFPPPIFHTLFCQWRPPHSVSSSRPSGSVLLFLWSWGGGCFSGA